MNRERPFEAVILDMDGVVTRTASLHEQAWKRMFDALLKGREGQAPFSSSDYRTHVDGKPRYEGVADFLSARDIELPRGEPADSPERETVCGLGNRKNELFLALLQEQGVDVFQDALAALHRWRRGCLKLAAVSSSRNCRRVLRSADLESLFDVIVDGQAAAEQGLVGKPQIMAEAAQRLAVAPSDTVVIEDATAGVRAGRQHGFGLVVGVNRNRHEDDLKQAGAHLVVSDVYRVRFPRRLPNALHRFEETDALRDGSPLAIFLDFDGTLAPIVDDPSEAKISQACRSALKNLRCPTAVVSGRDRADVESRVDIKGLYYAGNHGLDIRGQGHQRTLPEAEDALGDVDYAESELRERIGQRKGVIIERKRFSVAAHYRQVDNDSLLEEIRSTVDTLCEETALRKRIGKKVFELEPAVDWDKGRALNWLVDSLPALAEKEPFVIYIGDDETDEDAFAVLRSNGIGIHVGDEVARSLADYQVNDPSQVIELLGRFATLCDDTHSLGT